MEWAEFKDPTGTLLEINIQRFEAKHARITSLPERIASENGILFNGGKRADLMTTVAPSGYLFGGIVPGCGGGGGDACEWPSQHLIAREQSRLQHYTVLYRLDFQHAIGNCTILVPIVTTALGIRDVDPENRNRRSEITPSLAAVCPSERHRATFPERKELRAIDRQTDKLAQSRPPPVQTRSAAATSPPPLSPRTHSEKKSHHSRRRSGKDYVVAEKKSARPAPLSRRTTPQYNNTKVVGAGWSGGRTTSTRDRDREDEGVRDSGEGFPQFW
ncbi:hypothetical protein G7Y89_g2156 [Cudoniella acicularis]|uniref:Uncharacterized protein n=1 Tax=Cudoniella acicularis TaxID=354080 RepID=A0A8H4RVU1_9HELO|nr:hypothetical protein G7Y89_g2156 [Cudoniella acicularis]